LLRETFTALTSVRELSDGRIIVTDPREDRVVVADFKTQGVVQIGRLGKGPSEYSKALPLYPLAADSSIMVEMSRRWIIFDGDRIVSTIGSSEPAARLVAFAYGFDDRGNVLVRERGAAPPDSESLALIERGTGRSHTIARVRTGAQRTSNGIPAGLDSYELAVLAPDGWVAVLRVDPYRVDWRRPDGSWVRGRQIAGPQQFDARERERYERANAMGSRSGSVRWPSQMPPFATNWPPILTKDGRIVIRKVTSARHPGVRYDVINRQGQLERQLVLPSNERIIGFGNGTAYTVARDSLDLETLRRYAWK
jgi:hypothetical protein